MNPQEEYDLVQKVRSGDPEAFEMIVASYRQKVFGGLYHFFHSEREAEEVFWEVWEEVYRSLRNFQWHCSLSTWIYRITSHVALKKLRGKKRWSQSVEPLEALMEQGVEPASSQTTNGEAIRHEEHKLLYKAIRDLPEQLRLPFVLHEVMGVPYEEIATVIGGRPGALKTNVWRAKGILRKQLGDQLAVRVRSTAVGEGK